MTPARRATLTAGLLYLVTFIASIGALPLLAPVLHDPGFVSSAQPAGGVLIGGLLDLVNAAACVGTAVVLYPLLHRHGPAASLGFVTSRVLEAAIIVMGVICLFTVVTMRGSGDLDDTVRMAVAQALVMIRDWTFLIGPGLMPAINALLLGSVLFRARLVPRLIPLLGLIGALPQLVSVLASVFGLTNQVSVWSAIAVLPIFLWELSLGLWLAIRGFRAPVTHLTNPPDVPSPLPSPGTE